MKKNNISNYKAIDFFCGGGGMSCGLRMAGIDVIAGVDFDPDAKLTYETNNPGAKFILSDIKRLRSNYLERHLGVKQNDDHLIMVGCSPCQYYSLINTHKTKSTKSKDLLMNFARFVEYYNPGYVLVENVPGIITNKESILPNFLKFLQKKGYIYVEYKVIDLSYYGVPQSRKRFSLIASRVRPVKLPMPDSEQALLKNYIGEWNGFPKIEAGYKDTTIFNHTVSNLSELNKRRLDKTEKNGGSRLAWKDDRELQLPCFVDRDDMFVDTFGRMAWEKPAPTITTRFYSISNGRFAHPEENRAISLREGATLQTFPKNYIFKTNSIGGTAKLIGNAVPPEYARRLGLIIKQV